MIITIRSQVTSEERIQLMTQVCRVTGNLHPITTTVMDGRERIVLDATHLDHEAHALLNEQAAVEHITRVKTAYKLVSRVFKAEDTCVSVGKGRDCEQVMIGGTTPTIIAGPCAVENREQLLTTAHAVKRAGAHILRGGAFKPRTSPYQFQGLGIEGLHLLADAREAAGLPIITEVMEPDLVDTVAQHADILQIGSRNMQNFPLLLAAGRHAEKRPVLLKRGLSATIDEWLLAAEYIVAAGNPNVILCERGIRSYDQQTRNVLDLSCVPLLHELTHLPIIVDPSHATGKRELVPTMSRASIAAGADGLIIEVHQDPNNALCDGRQSITPEQLQKIVRESRLLTRMMEEEIMVKVA
ncbi:MAG: 3-deoxy-7-phosphoheptulonate synthase [Ktedonobacteraceae bacterium]